MLRSAFLHELSGTRTVHNAVLTAPSFNRETNQCSGALYDASGALVIDSVRPVINDYRPTDPVTIDRSTFPFDEAIRIDRGIFAGRFFFGWGHTLLETLSTAAEPPDDLSIPIVFLPWHHVVQNEWLDWYERHTAPLIRAAWGNRDILIARKPVHFNEVLVPASLATFGLTDMFHPKFGVVFERIRAAFEPNQQPSHPLLIKRDVAHRRWHPNEDALYTNLSIESIFAQEAPVEEQVRSYANCSTLIGFSGSVLHNSLFMPEKSTVIEIGDQAVSSPNRAQTLICQLRKQEHIFIRGFNGFRPRSEKSIIKEIEGYLNMHENAAVSSRGRASGSPRASPDSSQS